MKLTPEQLKAARDWLAECAWQDMEPEDFVEVSDADIERGIAKHYDGGVEGFLRDEMPEPEKPQHTPGPWTRGVCNEIRQGTAGLGDAFKRQHLIATCFPENGTRAELDTMFANARLIAAAPELLETCRDIEQALTATLFARCLDSTRPEFYALRRARDAARATIAKAEGRANT